MPNLDFEPFTLLYQTPRNALITTSVQTYGRIQINNRNTLYRQCDSYTWVLGRSPLPRNERQGVRTFMNQSRARCGKWHPNNANTTVTYYYTTPATIYNYCSSTTRLHTIILLQTITTTLQHTTTDCYNYSTTCVLFYYYDLFLLLLLLPFTSLLVPCHAHTPGRQASGVQICLAIIKARRLESNLSPKNAVDIASILLQRATSSVGGGGEGLLRRGDCGVELLIWFSYREVRELLD